MLSKAIKIIEEADWEKLRQMAGYVFSVNFIKGQLIGSIKLMEEKDLEKFIEFFEDGKIE